MTDAEELAALKQQNAAAEERLHAVKLCSDQHRPLVQQLAFMDLVCTALGIAPETFSLAVETRMAKLIEEIEAQVARAKLTAGVPGPGFPPMGGPSGLVGGNGR